HEKGIIHRDIKPSNVMVTLHDGTPVPKIIDFGVVKATNQRLTEKTLFTAYGEFVGTPAYMSPEQAELSGLELDRRSDIYSLGVLLYELLTGTTPFEAENLRSRAFLEIMRIIREDDPPTPSARLNTLGERLAEVASRRQVEPHALAKLVRGDLDWVVTKAMDKDRRRRYDSASALADDLARHFRHEPVSARRPNPAYRLRKFARRKRGPLLAAAAVAIAVVAGGAVARMGGLAGSPTQGAPTRRLFLDNAGNWNAARPTQDGRHVLRYDPDRRGYELAEVEYMSRDVTSAWSPRNVIRAGEGSVFGQSRLLTHAGPDPRPRLFVDHSLAPDGKQIAAVHWISSNPDRAPSRESDGGWELRLFTVGGEGEGRLLDRWGPGYRVQVFGWAPDRASVWVFVMRPDRAAEIASVALAGGSRRVLRTLAWRSLTQAPSLSPDGRFVAFHEVERPDSPGDLFLVATDGSGEVRVEHPADDSRPMFTPDGSGLVFRSTRSGGDLWFLPVANGRPAGEPRPVWSDIGPFGVADVFGQNGSLIYYFATERWEVYTAGIDLTRGMVGAPERIQPRAGDMNTAPAFSPDGRSLAHLRDRGRRLVLRELATGVEREFPIAGSLVAPQIDFCPDGRAVIVTGRGEGLQAFRVNLDRGGAERLPITTWRAVCVGDGREIVYLRQGDVVRRSLVTGAETTLNDGRAEDPSFSLSRSPDGMRIAFVGRSDNQAQVLVMPATGGQAQTVATSPIYRGGPNSWTEFHGIMWLPGGEGLLIARPSDAKAFGDADPEITFWRVSFDGSPASQAGRMRLPAYEGGFRAAGNYSLHSRWFPHRLPAARRPGRAVVGHRQSDAVHSIWSCGRQSAPLNATASGPGTRAFSVPIVFCRGCCMLRMSLMCVAVSLVIGLEVNAQDLVLTNAQILDPATRTSVRGSLWIEGGRIAGRGPEPPATARGERLDLKGRWVIPGLTDLHTHSYGNAAPRDAADRVGTQAIAMRVLRAGVTALLDLFDDEDAILSLRDRQRAGEFGGAEIFAAGPGFTATKGHPSQIGIPTRLIDSPADARKQLAELAVKRPDVVKVVYDHASFGPYPPMPSIDRATLEALIAAAAEHGLKTIVHVGSWEDVGHAVQAGATAVTHVARDGMVPDGVVALMAARRTYHIPTLTVHTERNELADNPSLIDSPLMVALTTEAIRAAYRKGLSGRTPEQAALQRAATATVIESVRRLHRAGVPMLTGTDGGNWGVVQGYSVHRELIRLVEAGLSPWDALASST
ncbi:MAG: protein kinase domain-containing protein, partial [Vicinamibacterales bacterium]